jgi:DNA modification methylase/predicted RNA-binding Zn-ribbon protein involved in translation (DUF1610 family)
MNDAPQLPGIAEEKKTGPVECLGMTFENDEARREYFLKLLAEKLKDPELRRTPGFPKASNDDILRLSDPPYYTACPNPFLEDFVRCYGKPYDPSEEYRREPFAVDVSVGKTDQLYKAHGYHTKVPHLAIVPSILHYTRPGDIVLDGFCGSGMTGVAAQWCGTAPTAYRRKLEDEWRKVGHPKPKWGARRVILGDLGPAATFIAANYNIPFDVDAFAKAAQRILDEVEEELGWMYETLHTDGKTKGRINYTVWSEVFSCPECSGEVVFLEEALDKETKRVHDEFPCPSCGALLTKKKLQRLYETSFDAAIGAPVKAPKRRPVLINYSIGKTKYEKPLDEVDKEILRRIEAMPLPPEVPTTAFPMDDMWEAPRLVGHGITHVHHMFVPRAAQSLAALWRRASAERDGRLRNMLLFFVEQAIWGMSVLNRYQPIQQGRPGGSQVNRQLSGVYYVASQIAEVSPRYNLRLRLDRLRKHAFSTQVAVEGAACVSTGDCASIPIPSDCIDYIFTDPPFGDNFPYSELNFSVEAWYRVLTERTPEAVVERGKKNSATQKGIPEYQDLMRRCFEEYHRVLKPGRWMTVVFSNSRNSIWRAIQEAMGTAGFVVADVRILDKKQRSFKQVTSSAVKQDLIISAYKPTEALAERFKLGSATTDSVWAFVSEHLRNVPVFVGRAGEDAEIISERTPQMLHDRMIAFFVQRRVAVPISGPDFFAGLDARYPRRDGMYFLPDQVAEYDRRRTTVGELRQLSLFVTDEATAVHWVRQQLQRKPQTFQELQPQFMQQIHAWAKHEKTIELKEILELNFFRYDGNGPVPSQIHSYLSTNFREYRNLDKDDPRLRAKAEDRWYVPDPKKEGDLERLRLRTLLREFEDYKTSPKRKIKQFRTEAVRAGFKHCYDEQDYQTIVDVAAKLPEKVIQEDEKLLMYYDVATMRLGGDL